MASELRTWCSADSRDFAREALLADKSKPGETLGRKATGRPRHETTAGLPGGNADECTAREESRRLGPAPASRARTSYPSTASPRSLSRGTIRCHIGSTTPRGVPALPYLALAAPPREACIETWILWAGAGGPEPRALPWKRTVGQRPSSLERGGPYACIQATERRPEGDR